VHRQIGTSTMYVTHDQVEAMTMGDRMAVLDRGVLQQYTTPRELYDRPVNLFAATFMGSPEMNLYEAVLDPSRDLVLGSQRLKLGQPPPGLAARAGAGHRGGRARQSAQRGGAPGPAPWRTRGSRVTFVVDVTRLHFFDPATGQAMR
jgi:ABC-type proline/glycine betaine transport system ATPase subunit